MKKLVKIQYIRKNEYENWNNYRYEDYNKCMKCDGRLRMVGHVNEWQMFECKKCKDRFVLNVFNGNIEKVR